MDEFKAREPFGYYSKMRKENPVFRDKEYGLWNVFKYDDVRTVLGNFNLFSSQFGKAFNPAGGPISESIINLDPPRHTKLRNIVSKAFTPRSIEKMAPLIDRITNELIEKMKNKKEFDVVSDFTSPLPVIVIARIMGIPEKDMVKFKEWSDVIVGGDEEQYKEFPIKMREMIQYFQDMVKIKEKDPQDDLITAIINAEVDGEKLTTLEMMGFFILLLVAGNETTTNLISNTFYTLNENKNAREELLGDEKLIPQAIEEVLRYRSPVQSIYRVAKKDVEISGVKIPAGSIVVPWIGSANRDETVFEKPDAFDIHRDTKKHIAFGEGIHYCLGAPLARLESRIAITRFLENFKEYSIDFKKPIVPQSSQIVYGFKELHIIQ
ncbi:cytochrome P450 [Caldiplasma sukawensis]